MADSIGSLTFEVGVLDSDISDLLKQLDTVRKAAEARLNLKTTSLLAPIVDATGKDAATLRKTLGDLSKDGVAAGKSLEGIGASAGRASRELSPLQKTILGLKNETAGYRSVVEATDVSNREAVGNFQRLRDTALELSRGLDVTSKEYRDLVGVGAQAARSLKTLEGQQTRLGFSGNTVVGITGAMRRGFGDLGTAITPLLGGAGLMGLANISGDLATKANAVQVSYDILNLTLDRTGQSSESAQGAISNVASALGVAEDQVVDYVTQLVRVGFTTEQAQKALIAGGASALAFGKSAAQGMDSVTSALVTQNSQQLNTIGIAENIGKVMGEAADANAEYGEAAAQSASAQAGLEVILKATGAEVESLDKLTGGLAGSQNKAATAAFEARQAFGEMLIPIETLKNEAIAGLLGQFNEMPDTMQSSVVGISGVTLGVSALATGLTAIRPLLAATFMPPGGALILGAVAATTLGVALFNVVKNMDPLADGLEALKASQDSLNESANTYVSQARNVVAALTSITDATTEEGLVGAIDTYISTLNEDGATAMRNFVANTLTGVLAQGDLQNAAKLTTEKILELETTSAQANVEANNRIIAANQETIGRLQRDIASLEQDAANARQSGMSRFAEANIAKIAELSSAVNQLSEENIRATRENEAYAGSLQRLETIQSEVANGTLTAEEALEQLVGNYENVSGALGKVFDQVEPTTTALEDQSDAASTAADGVELLSGAYADVTDAVELVPKAYATVTDAVDVSNKAFATVADAVDIGVTGYADVADAVGIMVEAYATVPDSVDIPIPEVEPILDYLAIFQDKLPKALKRSADEAQLFGENFDGVAEQAELVREEIESLLDQGLEPSDAVVQELSEQYKVLTGIMEEVGAANERYADNLSATRDAQEALADASSISTDEIDDLILSLADAAEGTGELGEQARQAKADLEALQVAREVGDWFSFLGDMAGDALESIPGLSDEATAGLGVLAGAGEEVFNALQDGTIDVGDAGNILTGAIEGIAAAFGDDLAPEAQDALTVVGGAVSGAAQGFAVGGPIGAAIGGLIGLFGGFGQAAADAAARAEKAAKEAEEAFQNLYETMSEIQDRTKDLTQDARQSAIDAAEASGEDPFKILIAQTQADLVEAHEDYMDTLEEIDALEEQAYQDYLAAGYSEEEARRLAEAKVQPLKDAAQITYENTVTEITENAEQAANDLGKSDEAFYNALGKPSEILNGLIPGYEQSFGNFIAIAEGGVHTLSATMISGGETLNASGRSFGVTSSQGLNAGAVMLTETAGSSFGSVSAAFTGLVGGLDRTTGSLSDTLSGSLHDLFAGSKDVTLSGGQSLNAALGSTLNASKEALRSGVSGSGGLDPLIRNSEDILASSLSGFFTSQRTVIAREGSSTVGSINTAAQSIRNAMTGLVNASSGYSAIRGTKNAFYSGGGGGGRTASFNAFQSLNEMVDPRALGGFGDDFSMSSLLYGNPEDEFGAGTRDPFGYGTLTTIQPVPERGGDFVRSAGPLGGLLASLKSGVAAYKQGAVSSLESARQTVVKGVSALSISFSSSIQTDTERTLAALEAARKKQDAYIKKYGTSKVNASDELKKAYAENKKALLAFEQDTFALISGRALTGYNIQGRKDGRISGLLGSLLGGSVDLIKGLTAQEQAVLDFAKSFGTALEGSVTSGISGGIKDAMKSGGVIDFKNLMENISGSVFDGLFDQVSDGILQKALGPLLTDLTANVTKGNVAASAANVSQIAAKLPAVAAQLQTILAPLQGILGGNASAASGSPSTGGITLEQRELGTSSVAPVWLDTLGSTLQKHADYLWKTALYERATAEMLRSIMTGSAARSRLTGGSSNEF